MRQYSLQTIKKSVDMKTKLEEAILGSGSARSDMMARRRQVSAVVQGLWNNYSSNKMARLFHLRPHPTRCATLF